MHWEKIGLIYKNTSSNTTHTHKPTVLVLSDRIRVYFGVRDSKNHTQTTYIDLDKNDLQKIIYKHNKPVLGVGKLGAFDDEGANVSSIIQHENRLYMYYIGWNTAKTVLSRNMIGLAISDYKGNNFERISDGPVIGLSRHEPYFIVAPYVIKETNLWRMWYTSGSGWKIINDKPEIHAHIKYAESKNGIDWEIKNISCIPSANEFEITARPSVIKHKGLYRMWFSFRSIENFRTDVNRAYSIGYAESKGGIVWDRKDKEGGLQVSTEGWDSQMVTYPTVFLDDEDNIYMIYNGNGFGKTGFGLAKLKLD